MQIVLFVSSSDAVKPGWLLKFLKGISPARVKEMQQNLAKVCDQGFVQFRFTYFFYLVLFYSFFVKTLQEFSTVSQCQVEEYFMPCTNFFINN